MSANDQQVGGTHYHTGKAEQHWDRIYKLYGRGYFVGCATKYIERYQDKNGRQDLEKAIHFIQKLIELEYPAPIESCEQRTVATVPSDPLGRYSDFHMAIPGAPRIMPKP